MAVDGSQRRGAPSAASRASPASGARVHQRSQSVRRRRRGKVGSIRPPHHQHPSSGDGVAHPRTRTGHGHRHRCGDRRDRGVRPPVIRHDPQRGRHRCRARPASLRGHEPGAPGGAGRTVHLRGMQQLPAGRPLAERAGRRRVRLRSRRAALAARGLLGLHRVEGSVREGRLHRPSAPICPRSRGGDRVHAAGRARRARLSRMGLGNGVSLATSPRSTPGPLPCACDSRPRDRAIRSRSA